MISCRGGPSAVNGKSKAASITWYKAPSHSLERDHYRHDQYNGASGVMSLAFYSIVVVCLMILFFRRRRDVNHACFVFDSAESVLNFKTLVILS
jgi:hypothetical protein